MQALLLSTTYYGGMVTIFFSGYVADRFGPKMILIGQSQFLTRSVAISTDGHSHIEFDLHRRAGEAS